MRQTNTIPSRAGHTGTGHDRSFYARTKAFGRFGMRLFTPQVMDSSHWHGHVEVNLLTGARMVYQVDEDRIDIPEGRIVVFWAGVPHRLTKVIPEGDAAPRLCNIYLPLDAFLFMQHIAPLQVDLLGGGLLMLPGELSDIAVIERWYRDYRSGDFERVEILKAELNTLFRRAQIGASDYLRLPMSKLHGAREIGPANIRHVVAMVRFILEHLDEPMTNADVASVTGLHQNYALSLFSGMMRMPMKRFIIRMRLLRARALLVENASPVAVVAAESGFLSLSQFYAHFKAAYGATPNEIRASYLGGSPSDT
ncbi:helix-turn-helix domain-containing protein [Qingshengfaniella alkalisoli]|uniref:Helix-turn-helix domain-containing protein n=1 Tax=Qingshengfaniella alkalisoli TaxID=2599296 RepID=A0A5B8J240_9RHOB|nr:helix-turn-helix domain-containing protein [Qingshengfaniella alkalisoli]QDY70858.1 helix-turn-helix domain-containing protein [Qingshengfaniella alkalisoli]